MTAHFRAREENYPGPDGIKRCMVPDRKVFWEEPYEGYKPVSYTAKSILEGPPQRVDPERFEYAVFSSSPLCPRVTCAQPHSVSSLTYLSSDPPKFYAIDGAVDRTSFEGIYPVIDDRIPLYVPVTQQNLLLCSVPSQKRHAVGSVRSEVPLFP
jgi:hypothetical protein